jgi:hypothetical protein
MSPPSILTDAESRSLFLLLKALRDHQNRMCGSVSTWLPPPDPSVKQYARLLEAPGVDIVRGLEHAA